MKMTAKQEFINNFPTLSKKDISITLDNVYISYASSIAVKNVFCDIKKSQ